eukprot:4220081-Pyramimonas_sp.AAC.1
MASSITHSLRDPAPAPPPPPTNATSYFYPSASTRSPPAIPPGGAAVSMSTYPRSTAASTAWTPCASRKSTARESSTTKNVMARFL